MAEPKPGIDITGRVHPLTRKIARLLVRYDLIMFAIALLILCITSLGLGNLSISSDNRNFFGNNNPEIEAVRDLEVTYSNSDSVFFGFVSKTEGFTAENLSHLRDFTEEAWQLPYVLRVESLANYNHSQANGDEIIVEPLIDIDAELTPEDVARIREIALSSDELVNRIVSADGRAFGVFVNLIPPKGEGDFRTEIGAMAREMKADWQKRAPDLNVYLSGGILAGVTFNEATRRDMYTLIPASFVVVTILMILGLGTIAGWIATTLVTIGGTVATMGFAGWMDIALIPATATSPLAVMVLVAASCVHLVLSWTRRLSENDEKDDATITSYEENLAAVAVTNITTAVGFLCLNFSESPPLAQMGNIIAFGIMIGWLLTSLLLPAVLKRCPDFQFTPVRVTPDHLDRLAQFTLRRQNAILWTFLVIIVLSIIGFMQIRFNDNALRYFDESYEFRRDSIEIERSLTGMESVQFSLKSPDDGSVFSPEFLQQADQFTAWLKEQDKVVYVGSLTNIVKRLNKTLGNDDAEAYRIADSREANAQAIMFYELSLPVGQDMNTMLDIGRTQTRLIAVLSDVNGREIRHFANTAEAWLQENTPQIATNAVSVGVAFAEISRRNNQAMLWGMLTVLILVSGIMVFTLRDLRLGALSLVPNVLPALLGFGLWGALVGEVNLGSTVVTTMTFGIVVDDTVHILMHYRRARLGGGDIESALRDTFRKVGTALMVTSVAIVSGFVIMTQSGFAINKHVGGLTAIVVSVALLTDLVLLPAVLKKARS